MPSQAAASNIHSATTVNTPGMTSTRAEAAHPAPVDPLDPDAPAKQRVPAIVDDRILPDMGTMDG